MKVSVAHRFWDVTHNPVEQLNCSVYGDLDLDSVHLGCLDDSFLENKRVLSELKKIGKRLKQESEHLIDKKYELERRKLALKDMEQHLNERESQISGRESSFCHLQSEIVSMRQDLDLIISERVADSIELERADFIDKIDKLKSSLSAKDKEILRLTSNFESLRGVSDKQKLRVSALEKENEALKKQLHASEGRVRNLQKIPKSSHAKSSSSIGIQCSHGEIRRKNDMQVNSFMKTLDLQLNWLCEVHLEEYKDSKLPENWIVNVRKILPVLSDLVNQPSLEEKYHFSLLRFVYWSIFHIRKTNEVLPFSSLHKISEVLYSSLEETSAGGVTSFTYCNSSEVKIRVLSCQIVAILSKEPQKLVKVFEIIRKDMASQEVRNILLTFCAFHELLVFLETKSSLENHFAADVLLQLSQGSDLLSKVGEVLIKEIVGKISYYLKTRSSETEVVEKLMIVFQRISKTHQLKTYFAQHSLIPVLQELWLKANNGNAFLALSVRSVLTSVGASYPVLK